MLESYTLPGTVIIYLYKHGHWILSEKAYTGLDDEARRLTKNDTEGNIKYDY